MLDLLRSVETKSNRNDSIDIIKAIGIILMVWGHTWPFCRNFIYTFHMAIFFIASGFCYSKKIDSYRKLVTYIKKKIKSLYIPFIICNGLFLLLYKVFFFLGLFTDNPSFILATYNYPVEQHLYTSLSLFIIIKKTIQILLFVGTTEFGTATWFLASLFLILVFHSIANFIIHKIQINKLVIYIVFLIIFSALSQYINNINPSIIFLVKCFPCSYSAFLLGILLQKLQYERINSWWIGVLSLIILILCSNSEIELSAGKIGNVLIYYIASLCGWFFLNSISHIILKSQVLTKCMVYVGQNTLPILCLHVLCFKFVSYIYICVNNMPMYFLASFHIIFSVNGFWKFMYVLCGVFIPLLLYEIYCFIKKKCFVR